ncbi:hypothetical protein [Bradyrhizobium sp. CIR3A]|uniref:hypothetical protein n=1 Tax=Bradyrhizobium TaxID=374 RepID=UPI0015C8CA3E|nr:hypothetical protein [Bradyrhizobium sp. CIR3A]MBB4264292.1 hypothetical protein [Bradyrhizobium sp. CIR3A]NYG50043.1 hypothetical protein [Bradyrhizobium sp. IAR9]
MSEPSPPHRISEIAELLALGLSRIQARKASGLIDHTGDVSLDISPDQSGHAAPLEWRMVDG